MLKRVSISFFALMIVFGILIVNLALINLKAAATPASMNNSERSLTLSESRGMIYDCNMKPLVNSEAHNITVLLPTENAFNEISPYITEEEKDRLYKSITDGKLSVTKGYKKLSESDIKTVSVTDRYAKNQHCIHLIGHLNEAGKGATGLEKAYDNFLNMQSGALKAVWNADALGHILYGNGIGFKSENYLSPSGIQLTIDLTIQEIAETALTEHGVGCGASVIIDAETAEVLACASLPTFDPNNLSAYVSDKNAPFLNRALTPYSVGSVFKPFVASVAIENNIEIMHDCVGSIKIGGTVFGCNDNTVHGFVDLRGAMDRSCNAYFIALGQKVGAEKLVALSSSMGLGKSEELADNFYLKAGYLPTADEFSSPQDLANLSFGQGKLLASPIQMACAYACFANGGYYRPPTLMKGIIDKNGYAVQRVRLPPKKRVLNKSTTEEISTLLRSVVTEGNGNKAYSEFTDARGKTATAQSGWYEDGREITHTWFCGYFTAGNRKIVAVIMKEDGVSGGWDCAPIFKDISEKITEYLK